MIYNNRIYPHPVLGIADDFSKGEISVELKVSSDGSNIVITPIFVLNSQTVDNLIEKDAAVYVSHLYCRGTVYREIFRAKHSLAESITIPANKLNGEVEIDFFICAMRDVVNYSGKDFNADYENAIFSLEKADIVAYAGKGKFYANKTPIELRSVSALMFIDCTGKHNEPMSLDYEGEKIAIMLCVEDYANFKLIKKNDEYIGVILSSIVLPALIEALYFLDDRASDSYKKSAWYKALQEIKNLASKKFSDPFRIAQNILENPINKCFNLLTQDNYD